MSRKTMLIAAAVVALLAAGGLGFYFYQQAQDEAYTTPQAEGAAAPAALPGAAAPAAKGPLPNPVFLVLDKQAVLRFSKAGKDITAQLQPIIQKAQSDILGQRAALERQANDIRQNTTLSPEEREKRAAALEAKTQQMQAAAQQRQEQLSDALNKANAPISKAVSEIVPAIAKQRGANIVLERAALAQADPAFDITQDVISQLDARLPSLKVELK